LKTPHRLETGEEVFDHPRQGVAGVGFTIGRRGSFIKYPDRLAGPEFQGLFEDLPLLPEFLDPPFQGGEVERGIHRFENGHSSSFFSLSFFLQKKTTVFTVASFPYPFFPARRFSSLKDQGHGATRTGPG
jgi:hypothetical protein